MVQSNSATSKKTKLIYFIVVTITLLVVAVLIWAFQTGRLSSSADTGSSEVMDITNICSDGQQTEKITWDAYAGATSYSVKVYKDSTWQNISNCYKITSRTCTYGPHDPHEYNFRVIAHTASTNPLHGEERTTQCTETASPTPTATGTSTECTTGQKQCKGDVIQKCMNGSWASSTSCALSGQTCQSGECVGSATSSASPTSSTGLTLNAIVSSCLSSGTVTNQNNHLSWNQISSPNGYAFLVKSDNTNGEYSFANTEVVYESITQVDLIYPSVNNVYYKVVDRATQTIQSNEQPAENKQCGATVSPTVTSTATKPAKPTGVVINTLFCDPAEVPEGSACALNYDDDQPIYYILTWPDPASSGVGYYEVYNKDNATTPIATFVGSTGKNISYTLSGLECKKDYGYYVVAVNDIGKSDPSDTATVTSQICGSSTDIANTSISGLAATPSEGGVITLSWTKNDLATGYDIYDCDGNYIVSTANTSYLFTGKGCDKSYCYKVQAHDGAGNKSQFSNSVSVNSAACSTSTTSSTSSLVSTGSSLWFNIALALILALALGYLIFRKDIWEKK